MFDIQKKDKLMIKNNKVINKILLPKVLSFILLASIIPTATVYVTEENTTIKNHPEIPDILLKGLSVLLAVFLCADLYSDYKKGEKFSMLIASKYLKQELKKHPELKIFENVLDNQQALQNISALIFNSLRPSERKIIAKIVRVAYNNLRNHKKYDSAEQNIIKISKKLISETCNQIVSILKEHESIHPEFIRDIYSAMAHADMVYIMPQKTIQQHTK